MHLAVRSAVVATLLLLLTGGAAQVPSQAAPGAAPGDTVRAEAPVKLWIFFTDKETASPEANARSSFPVSDAALARRQRRGTRVSAEIDRPVATRHLDQLARLGIRPLVESRWLNAVSAFVSPSQVEAVAALPFVKEIRPVARFVPARQASALPPLPVAGPLASHVAARARAIDFGRSERQLRQIGAIGPLEQGINGTGVRIGFLDTEFGGFEHPVFQQLREENRILGTKNFTGGSQPNRHGMNVASVAVGYLEGQLVGPAHGAQVLGGTTEWAPTETNQEEDNLVAGLEWLESQGVDVVNISLGYTTFDAGQRSYTQADLDGDTGVTTRAADRAVSLGVVIVAAAGNEGSCSDPSFCWYYISTPADGDSVIAVGAVDVTGARASFSSHGPTADGRIKPDVAAPGTEIYLAAGSGFAYSAGTSFASPLVAGVVAQLLQVKPDLTPMEVRDVLRQTASLAAAPNNELGYGIVNAEAAIAIATGTDHEAPVTEDAVQLYPNPVVDDRVYFEVHSRTERAQARLVLYDVLGRVIGVAFDGRLSSGTTTISYAADELMPGLYLYRLSTPGFAGTGTFLVVE